LRKREEFPKTILKMPLKTGQLSLNFSKMKHQDNQERQQKQKLFKKLKRFLFDLKSYQLKKMTYIN